MKNKMQDVRDHLVAMMEALADDDVDAEVVERAKATALLADKFIASAKCEVDACRLAHDMGGKVPQVFAAPDAMALPSEHTAPARR